MTSCSIFHLEDNPTDRMLLSFALAKEAADIRIHVADDGEKAIAMLSQAADNTNCRPDAVVLDLNLPKFSGVEVLRALRGKDGLKDVPVVVLTSSDSLWDRNSVEEIGIEKYLLKPSSIEAAVEVAREILSLVKQ